VTWRSKKQHVVSRSSTKSKFRALALGIYEGMGIHGLLKELGVEMVNPIKMFCDNQTAISIAKNLVHHDRKKHIEIDPHFISKKIEKKLFIWFTFSLNLKLQIYSPKPFQELILKN